MIEALIESTIQGWFEPDGHTLKPHPQAIMDALKNIGESYGIQNIAPMFSFFGLILKFNVNLTLTLLEWIFFFTLPHKKSLNSTISQKIFTWP